MALTSIRLHHTAESQAVPRCVSQTEMNPVISEPSQGFRPSCYMNPPHSSFTYTSCPGPSQLTNHFPSYWGEYPPLFHGAPAASYGRQVDSFIVISSYEQVHSVIYASPRTTEQDVATFNKMQVTKEKVQQIDNTAVCNSIV